MILGEETNRTTPLRCLEAPSRRQRVAVSLLQAVSWVLNRDLIRLPTCVLFDLGPASR